MLEVPPVTGASVAPSLFDGVGVGVGVGAGAGAGVGAVILIIGAEYVAGAGVGVGAGVGEVALAVGGVPKPLLPEAIALLEVPPGADAV